MKKRKFKSERERVLITSPAYAANKEFLDDIHEVTEDMTKDGTFEPEMIYSIQDEMLSAFNSNELTEDEKSYYIKYCVWGFLKILMERFKGSELINLKGAWYLNIPINDTSHTSVCVIGVWQDLKIHNHTLIDKYNHIIDTLNGLNPYPLFCNP